MTPKEKIILNIFEIIHERKTDKIQPTKILLEELAKKYKVNTKKKSKVKPNLIAAYKEFISNGSGYIETIPKLYNAL